MKKSKNDNGMWVWIVNLLYKRVKLGFPPLIVTLSLSSTISPISMAASSASACLLQPNLKTFLIISLLVFVLLVHGLKPPIRPRDILPLLPRQLSWPILNYLHSAVDILPTFVGSASSNETVVWKGTCFHETKAWMEFNNKSRSEFGGGTLHIKVWDLIALFDFVGIWIFRHMGFGRS